MPSLGCCNGRLTPSDDLLGARAAATVYLRPIKQLLPRLNNDANSSLTSLGSSGTLKTKQIYDSQFSLDGSALYGVQPLQQTLGLADEPKFRSYFARSASRLSSVKSMLYGKFSRRSSLSRRGPLSKLVPDTNQFEPSGTYLDNIERFDDEAEDVILPHSTHFLTGYLESQNPNFQPPTYSLLDIYDGNCSSESAPLLMEAPEDKPGYSYPSDSLDKTSSTNIAEQILKRRTSSTIRPVYPTIKSFQTPSLLDYEAQRDWRQLFKAKRDQHYGSSHPEIQAVPEDAETTPISRRYTENGYLMQGRDVGRLSNYKEPAKKNIIPELAIPKPPYEQYGVKIKPPTLGGNSFNPSSYVLPQEHTLDLSDRRVSKSATIQPPIELSELQAFTSHRRRKSSISISSFYSKNIDDPSPITGLGSLIVTGNSNTAVNDESSSIYSSTHDKSIFSSPRSSIYHLPHLPVAYAGIDSVVNLGEPHLEAKFVSELDSYPADRVPPSVIPKDDLDRANKKLSEAIERQARRRLQEGKDPSPHDGNFDCNPIRAPSITSFRSSITGLDPLEDASTLWEKALRQRNEETTSLSSPRSRWAPSYILEDGSRSGKIISSRRTQPQTSKFPSVGSPRAESGLFQATPKPTSKSRVFQDIAEPSRSTPSFQSWNRFPSHTRDLRSASATALDAVAVRDFAYEQNNISGIMSESGLHTGTPKRCKSPGSKTLRKGVLAELKRLYKSRSTDLKLHLIGRRQSKSFRGLVEYPELEIPPPSFEWHSSSEELHPSAQVALNAALEASFGQCREDAVLEQEQEQEEEDYGDVHVSNAVPKDAKEWSQLYGSCVVLPDDDDDNDDDGYFRQSQDIIQQNLVMDSDGENLAALEIACSK
ncbi:MAG: hypothetical protein M1829_002882 [Trizodia sp. TS-e1964]|nr:MAG: hypothetical protein M1829_002882 [Trizodia sp. TS-e1964]